MSLVAVCQADLRLLSYIDPLPLDRLSCHTAAAIRSWPSTDRRHILAVAIRDIRAPEPGETNFSSTTLILRWADDDSLTLMSAELLPRLEGGIRAALEEVDTL